MNGIKGDRLYVNLSASQLRKRLKGHGFGVRKIESAGRNRAVIIHTATGQHLRELKALLGDAVEPAGVDAGEQGASNEPAGPARSAGRPSP